MDIHERIYDGEFTNKLPYGRGELGTAYHEEERRLTKRFQEALAEEYDMVGHPKEQLLFDKAWDIGHASGHTDIALYYANLLELVR